MGAQLCLRCGRFCQRSGAVQIIQRVFGVYRWDMTRDLFEGGARRFAQPEDERKTSAPLHVFAIEHIADVTLRNSKSFRGARLIYAVLFTGLRKVP